MNAEQAWEKRRLGVEKAVQAGFSKEAIGRAIGTDGSNLSNMLVRKAPRSKFVAPLDSWLEENVWSRGASTPQTTGPVFRAAVQHLATPEPESGDAALDFATELESVVRYLRSPRYTLAEKRETLILAVEGLYKRLPMIRRTLDESGK